jgi:hypothetical protein
MIISGEFHPFRYCISKVLPIPVDIVEKGLNPNASQTAHAVPLARCLPEGEGTRHEHRLFLHRLAVLEGKPGEYSAEGVFALEPFFDAAKQAGIYLIARPGPYINAEASGGGFPGWLQRLNATLRTKEPGYLDATNT